MGVRMTVEEDAIFVEEQDDLKPVDIKTSPYPGFATDLQQPMTPLLLKASGRGKIIDTIYEKRVNHVPELARMGADIQVLGGQIVYNGPTQLSGVLVKASDYVRVRRLLRQVLWQKVKLKLPILSLSFVGIQISLRNFLTLVQIFV